MNYRPKFIPLWESSWTASLDYTACQSHDIGTGLPQPVACSDTVRLRALPLVTLGGAMNSLLHEAARTQDSVNGMLTGMLDEQVSR